MRRAQRKRRTKRRQERRRRKIVAVVKRTVAREFYGIDLREPLELEFEGVTRTRTIGEWLDLATAEHIRLQMAEAAKQ